MKDSYSNPFGGVNAVQLKVESILEYWCNPFIYDLFSGIKEQDIFEDSMNIIFMGGRSTGKSMFLRYWSYPVQFLKAEKEKIKLCDCIKKNKGIGFYYRIDGPIIRFFQGKGIDKESWASIFTHYFELIIGRQYLEVLNILIISGELENNNLEDTFLPELRKLMGITNSLSLLEIINDFDKRITEVDLYRGNLPFYKNKFVPKTRGFSSQDLSFGIAELMLQHIDFFKDLNFIILLDEYENFLEYQQEIINTLLRFSRPQIKFRLGMRLEGFKTYNMITEEDFIKEAREYRKVIFEEVLNKDKGYHNFLIDISKKRLESIPILKEKGYTDIKSFLSDKENIEQEAKSIVKDNPKKITDYFLKKGISSESLLKVKFKDNPLLELLNNLWLVRGVTSEKIIKSMSEYLNGIETEDSHKYKRDYVDKYKYSLLFLLCSIYRTKKLYYSFNTFAFLSSGIVGHFVELCRRSFAIAGWGDNDKLLDDGVISIEHQSKAAYEFSNDEKKQINRIDEFGGLISKFVENIGNIFRDYHIDYKVRYPETNQFSNNIDAIENDKTRKALQAAIRWSVIQRKPAMQRTGPSESRKDLFTLNRIFSPAFQISYRTRGGKSIILDEEKLIKLMTEDSVDSSLFLPKSDDKNELNLFS